MDLNDSAIKTFKNNGEKELSVSAPQLDLVIPSTCCQESVAAPFSE